MNANAVHHSDDKSSNIFLSVSDVAKRYGISEGTVRTMIRCKQIPFVSFRKRYVFRLDVLEKWEIEQMQGGLTDGWDRKH